MPAPEAPDLALHPALLMSPVLARAAKERVKGVVAAQGDKPIRLDAVAALEHLDHRGFEVVVADPARHAPKMSKRQQMPLQERLLALADERGVIGPARAAQPHDEHPTLD